MKKRSKKATFWGSFGLLFVSIGLLLGIRWALIEPFIIPSGSMIPHLLVHDHIFVNKLHFGLRIPLTTTWVWRNHQPQVGEVLVFRSVEENGIYLIKRVVGLPGDEIAMDERGQLVINGQVMPLTAQSEIQQDGSDFKKYFGDDWIGATEYVLYNENLHGRHHPVFMKKMAQRSPWGPVTVPAGHYFMMGDNRDHSNDSRFWGSVPLDKFIGKAMFVWYSCDRTIPQSQMICDPSTTRTWRLLTPINAF